MFKLTYKACKQDSGLAIGLFTISISRNYGVLQQVMFQNWINSFDLGELGMKVW